ncbi:hypothetical protein [Paraburkholderia caledonica]|uniref:hypothetical protein n=1 Tax=Paraburkholderia caledonica TaxID=134536 RepID=UPI0013DF413C|nr:hypothetical protein [Paraburkholderia caledonica]
MVARINPRPFPYPDGQGFLKPAIGRFFFWKSRMSMNSEEWTRRRFRHPHKMAKMEISLKNRQARAVINI